MPAPPLAHRCALVCAVLLCGAGMARADEAAAVHGLIGRGELQAALERADKALQDKPQDAQARFLKGVVLMDLERDAEAMALFVRMTQEYPELPDPYNNIALLQVRAGHLELAQQALESALRSDPGHRIARANLGQVHLMLAIQAWARAAATGPVDRALQRRLDGARALLADQAPPAR